METVHLEVVSNERGCCLAWEAISYQVLPEDSDICREIIEDFGFLPDNMYEGDTVQEAWNNALDGAIAKILDDWWPAGGGQQLLYFYFKYRVDYKGNYPEKPEHHELMEAVLQRGGKLMGTFINANTGNKLDVVYLTIDVEKREDDEYDEGFNDE